MIFITHIDLTRYAGQEHGIVSSRLKPLTAQNIYHRVVNPETILIYILSENLRVVNPETI